MANQPKTTARAVRISDEVWEAAKARAEKDGVTTTDVVRRALVKYLDLPSDTTGWATDRQRTGLPSTDDA
jgi:antitoxin component of RelBE/YafQ-DinJ toxin-antitoxin module